MLYDVVIVGGGPGGLAAALALGRARKRVLLCDSGPRRNAAASHLHNFVTRDGTPPEEFRRIGREQLASYPEVEVRDLRVESVSGTRGAFLVRLGASEIQARRVLLCTGMIDESLPIEGFRELWGNAIFQCPYCHGWEAQDRRWGVLLDAANVGMLVPFTLMLRGWTRNLLVFKAGSFEIPEETSAQLERAGVRIEIAPAQRLVARGRELEAVELSTGDRVPCDVLFAHPPQRQVDLVRSLDLELDEHGFVRVEAMKGETSIPGIFAAGDLTTRGQSAIFAASAGVLAATMINLELNSELALSGAL
jgi:thioredoxin reductase